MTTSTVAPDAAHTPAPRPTTRPRTRPTIRPIPLRRIAAVELRKSFDTRSGFWLLAGVGIAALLATTAVLLLAPEDQLTYDTFAAAVGFPMSVILPMVAILAVTGEWSQRSGLTTFTLVPHRGRVVLAKGIVAVSVGVASMVLALAVGALGNVVGSTIAGVPIVWDDGFAHLGYIVLGNTVGLLVGFMLGVLIRSSPGAIVAYFVWALLLPTLGDLLATSQAWFADLRPWVDLNQARNALFNGTMGGEQWANLGVSGTIWLLAPLAVGVAAVLRSEVK